MKKATLIIWAIIVGVMALLIFQNQEFFLTNQSLRLNLGVLEEYHTPELPIAVMVLLFFLAGYILAYLFNASARFKAKRSIKKLNTTMASHSQEMAGLKGEIDSLKGIEAPAAEQAPGSEIDMAKTQKISYDSLATNTAEQTGKLQETTGQLKAALASTKARGQWGERMAEDVLRLAGFIEGVNYRKQKTLETVGTRPDYTFLLPQDLTVNMDVKFPLDNYMRYLDADGETDKERHKNQFIKDVRRRIKEVTTREYINPAENTVDYVIVFIPNEQVYAFINENDSSVLDEALKHKVILCSPITLYAVLAVIRQAVDNFNLEKTAAQIMSLLGTFNITKLLIEILLIVEIFVTPFCNTAIS